MRLRPILLLLVVVACRGSDGPPTAPLGDRIAAFVAAEGVPDFRFTWTILEDPARDLALFRVERRTPPLPSAYGLLLGDRIGWLEVPPDVPGGTAFDLRAEEAVTLAGLREEIVASEATALAPVLLFLVRDPDTPEAVLVDIAAMLFDDATGERSLEIAGALLDHPLARQSRPVLEALIRSVGPVTNRGDIRARAWALLAELQTPLEDLEIGATVERTDGAVHAILSIRNPGPETLWIEHSPSCRVELLVFAVDDPDAEPVWDGAGWTPNPFGGCKLPNPTSELAAGETLALGAPPIADESILGDSIPPGSYDISIRVRVSMPRDTTLVVAAGRIDLENTLARDLQAPIQTGALHYELETTEIDWQTRIDFAFTNPTGGDAFLVRCGESYAIELERFYNGDWLPGWAPIRPLCLSIPPYVVGSGETFRDTLNVTAGLPGGNLIPRFTFQHPGGIYRIVLHPLSSFDPDQSPFGPELPLTARISNSFRIVIAGE